MASSNSAVDDHDSDTGEKGDSLLSRVFDSCSDDPKGSVHRAWGVSLIFLVVYFVLAIVESKFECCSSAGLRSSLARCFPTMLDYPTLDSPPALPPSPPSISAESTVQGRLSSLGYWRYLDRNLASHSSRPWYLCTQTIPHLVRHGVLHWNPRGAGQSEHYFVWHLSWLSLW